MDGENGFGGRGRGRGRGGGFRGRGRGGRLRGRSRRWRGGTEGPTDELKLYVGSLSWNINAAGLKAAFEPYGNCEAIVMLDKFTWLLFRHI